MPRKPSESQTEYTLRLIREEAWMQGWKTGADDQKKWPNIEKFPDFVPTPNPYADDQTANCLHVYPDGRSCTLADHSAPGLAETHGLT
jgi:hypothetical protein